MSEQDYVQMVTPLTDGEEVLAAGVFEPRGTSGGQAAASTGFAGRDLTLAAISTAAMAGAGHAAAVIEHQPRWTILTVTPTRVIAFEGKADGVHWKPGQVYATFDRSSLAVTVHGRVNVRVVVLEDTASGTRLELETMRIGPQHGTVVIHLLTDSAA